MHFTSQPAHTPSAYQRPLVKNRRSESLSLSQSLRSATTMFTKAPLLNGAFLNDQESKDTGESHRSLHRYPVALFVPGDPTMLRAIPVGAPMIRRAQTEIKKASRVFFICFENVKSFVCKLLRQKKNGKFHLTRSETYRYRPNTAQPAPKKIPKMEKNAEETLKSWLPLIFS